MIPAVGFALGVFWFVYELFGLLRRLGVIGRGSFGRDGLAPSWRFTL